MTKLPPILDACCGPKAMWFDRNDSRCLFVDRRRETHEMRHHSSPRSPIVIDPDRLCDFTSLPFRDNSFGLVVFDPPHVIREQMLGNVTKFYGVLNGDWRSMLQRGFAECFRVLSPGGVLIFKWTETQIPLREILTLTPEKPLFGHKSGAKARTHWCTFMKTGWQPPECQHVPMKAALDDEIGCIRCGEWLGKAQ